MTFNYAEEMFSLFRGSNTHYGKYDLTDAKKVGLKLVAQTNNRSTITGSLTVDLWNDHLLGNFGIGIVPIFNKTKVVWGAIDIDEYDLDYNKILVDIEKNKLPLVTIKSKSGGIHCYLFCNEEIEAEDMIACLKVCAQKINFAKVVRKNGSIQDTETYPKQSEVKVDQGDSGNWLNMPYFDYKNGIRKCIVLKNDLVTELEIEEFIQYANNKKISYSDLLDITEDKNTKEILLQGPPCLNYLLSKGKINEGGRNNALYNLGIYAKKMDPNNWEKLIDNYNREYLDPPLQSEEVVSITKSLKRKEYNYKCEDSPICSVCNPNLCRTKRYGVSGSNTFISIDSVSKLLTTPPIYFINVNGKRIEASSSDIYDQRAFGKKCIETLDFVPALVKPEVWLTMWNNAFKNINLIYPPEDEGQIPRLYNDLMKYCSSRLCSKTVEEFFNTSKPYTDDQGYTYFKIDHFFKWLENSGNKEFKKNQITGIFQVQLQIPVCSLYHYDENKVRRNIRAWKVKTNKQKTTDTIEGQTVI